MLLLLLAAPAAPGNGTMNLLFSMADQMRWDALSSVNPNLHTPNLDAMASEGIRALWAYTSTPSCTPARAALLTGRSPWGHGMLGYGQIAQRYPFEYPRALAAAGYETSIIGKDHYGWDNSVKSDGSGQASSSDGGKKFAHGFGSWNVYDGVSEKNGIAVQDEYDSWFNATRTNKSVTVMDCWPTLDMNSWRGAANVCNEGLHPTAYVGRRAVDFLEAHAGAGAGGAPPFFLKVSFHRPHSPYDPPPRLLEATSGADMPTPVTSADGWSDRFKTCDVMATLDTWCGAQDASAELLSRRAYHASTAFVDEQIGLMHGALLSTGLLRRTLWLFTSDHGDAQGDHYHWRKAFPYELSAHVPLLIRWPEDAWRPALPTMPARGGTVDALVELRDIAPTLLQAGGALPANASSLMEGRSLLCLLGGCGGGSAGPGCAGCPTAPWRETLDLEHDICYKVCVSGADRRRAALRPGRRPARDG
jgi:arylsulfatase A-like enzyme